MAKIIHAAEFHLGAQFAKIGKAGDFVRKALKDSLERSVTTALDSSVDLFLVCGNLLSSNLISRNLLGFLYGQIERLGRTPFVVLPGTIDPYDVNSIYRNLPSEGRPDNLFILGNGSTPFIHFQDTEITVYGLHFHYESGFEAPAQAPAREPLPGVHILALPRLPHSLNGASDQPDIAFLTKLQTAGFDYVAVGGASSFVEFGAGAYCSGAPEAISPNEGEQGVILLVDIGAATSVEKVPTGQLQWRELSLDSDSFRYNIEIERELAKYAGTQSLLHVNLTGRFHPDGFIDVATLLRSEREKFCFLEIEDRRVLTTNDTFVAAAQPGTLAGEYGHLMREAVEKTPGELREKYLRALLTGSALLSGKDVVS